MRKEIEYDIYCDGKWCAGTNDLGEAMHYGHVYSEDGAIEIHEVTKGKGKVVVKMSAKVRGEK
jgi:hypothetical protein